MSLVEQFTIMAVAFFLAPLLVRVATSGSSGRIRPIRLLSPSKRTLVRSVQILTLVAVFSFISTALYSELGTANCEASGGGVRCLVDGGWVTRDRLMEPTSLGRKLGLSLVVGLCVVFGVEGWVSMFLSDPSEQE